MDAGFDLQPVEKTLNRLSVLADISVETITGTQDITRQIFLGCNYTDFMFIFHGFVPRGVNIGLIGK